MKILLANSAFGGGGVTAFAEQLIKCLSREHELTVVLRDDSLRPIKAPGVKVIYHDAGKLTKENALLFLKLINEEIRPDLVISSLGMIIPVIAPFIDDRIRVMTVSHSGKYFNSEYTTLNHSYIDNIIAASSDFNKRHLERRFHIRDKEKVKVIYNFMASNPELEACRETKKNNDPFGIVFAGGGRSAAKNPDFVLKVLLELLKTDLDFRFYWTGNTMLPLMHVGLLKKMKTRDIRQFVPRDKRVVFPGKIASKGEFDRLIASANILVTPSRNEGCSMLLLEALRSGAICVVCDYPHGNREIVEKGRCGFVINRKHPEDASRKIAEVIAHREEYLPYYDRAYDTYQSMLSYGVWSSSLAQLIAGGSRHEQRLKTISESRLAHDIRKMNRMKKNSSVRRFFQITIPCLRSFFFLYLRMKLMGEFPKTENKMETNE